MPHSSWLFDTILQTYLKEILKEVCVYNLKNPHKNTWELKPEYRCYKKSDDED